MTAPISAPTAGGVATPPARPGSIGGVAAALYVDLEGVRARYECLRPGCTQPLEGPVYGDDVKPFVDTIRTHHPARCTGVPR
ncbi:hypothetical protein AB0D47_02620 [Streptomyces sp. NPDC048376]|uniref:hypothetical protein n=1 Tax=Streptomyces sp. NPDC048376 TaxID=3154926 RepID=UPI00343E844F